MNNSSSSKKCATPQNAGMETSSAALSPNGRRISSVLLAYKVFEAHLKIQCNNLKLSRYNLANNDCCKYSAILVLMYPSICQEKPSNWWAGNLKTSPHELPCWKWLKQDHIRLNLHNDHYLSHNLKKSGWWMRSSDVASRWSLPPHFA